jgi:hypothetical protein
MRKAITCAAGCLACTAPAFAEVKTSSDTGFNIVHIASVKASPDEIWKRLIAPNDWWNKSHSWSGSTEGFYIDAQANGCFCELFQEKGTDGKVKTVGSVEHILRQPASRLEADPGTGRDALPAASLASPGGDTLWRDAHLRRHRP